MCAKSKSFFGLRRGSTKSLTFQVLDGQQITKDRVTEVRNPRTEKQRIQRVIMNTALRAYSAMKEICDHSFEGIAYGGKSQQAFLAENIRAARMRLADKGDAFAAEKAFTPLGKTFVAPNAYIVSKGSLPSAQYTLNNGLHIEGGSSYASLLSALRANAGDQMTICALVGDDAPQNTRFVFCRVILMPQNVEGNNIELGVSLVSGSAISTPNLRNENTNLFSFAVSGSELVVTVPNAQIHAAAVIISRKAGNVWLRSSQSMVFAEPKIGFTLAEAIETSTYDIDVVDPYYLNNASASNNTPSADNNNQQGGGNGGGQQGGGSEEQPGGDSGTKYTLTLQSNNSAMGYVSGGGQYAAGATATIKATPNSGYLFDQWSDGSRDAQRSYTVTRNQTLIATFYQQGTTRPSEEENELPPAE